MSTTMPEGAGIRKAVKWISEMRAEGKTSLPTLIDQACMRFNLSPKDCDFLIRFFREQEQAKTK